MTDSLKTTERDKLEELLLEANLIVRLAAEDGSPNRELAFFAERLRFIIQHGEALAPTETIARERALESAARAECIAWDIDPDHICHGVGRFLAEGTSMPAWRVRLPMLTAAIDAYLEAMSNEQ